MKRWLACLLVWLMCIAACDAAADTDSAPEAADAGMPIAESGCAALAGPAPATVAEVIALLNTMPKPVTVPCLLEALPHPFSIQAVNSILSAQPAVGKRSPRIFIFFDRLILSVVPAGEGAHLLEFGERRNQTHTLKAELEFPITTELDVASSPYTRLRFDDQHTTCGFCHAEEDPADDIGHAYARISRGIKPMTSQRVSIAELQAELASCDALQEPERCAMLRALLGPARTALDGEFPAEWKTFF